MENEKYNYDAISIINGSPDYPDIYGYVIFKQIPEGVMVQANIKGLPQTGECGDGIFGFHIHEGSSCSGNNNDYFSNVGKHYTLNSCPHPYHTGDLPPLFGNRGHAYMCVLTDRFKLDEVIGKTIIVHDKPDDFTTQPSGNSGEKIACGEIKLSQDK